MLEHVLIGKLRTLCRNMLNNAGACSYRQTAYTLPEHAPACPAWPLPYSAAGRRQRAMKRIRWGMVGGGQGGFIGEVHRMAARLDDRYQLIAGALSSDPERARHSAREGGIGKDRTYIDYREMARAESSRPDGIEAVSIVTPNASHHAIAANFLDRGIHVICDKPLATRIEDGRDLVARAAKSDR